MLKKVLEVARLSFFARAEKSRSQGVSNPVWSNKPRRFAAAFREQGEGR